MRFSFIHLCVFSSRISNRSSPFYWKLSHQRFLSFKILESTKYFPLPVRRKIGIQKLLHFIEFKIKFIHISLEFLNSKCGNTCLRSTVATMYTSSQMIYNLFQCVCGLCECSGVCLCACQCLLILFNETRNPLFDPILYWKR